jgi:hypothetical protein
MDYTVNLPANLEIKIDTCNFKSITSSFLFALKGLFEQYIMQILLHNFEVLYQNGELAKMLSVQSVSRKTTNCLTKFKTLFGEIWVPQIKIRVVDFDGKKRQMSITRILLGVGPKQQIPDFMKEIIAWIAAVATYRVGHKIIGVLTNFKCSVMSVWRAVQWSAPKIKLELSETGTNETQCDGTGIPTVDSGKRGSELKKIFQLKKDGKLHLIGMSIGTYKNAEDWKSMAEQHLLVLIRLFGKVFVGSDGDKTILETVLSISERVKIQFDIWHVFHQMKYYLWKDGVPKDFRSNIISRFFKKTMLSKCSTLKRDSKIKRYIFLLRAAGLTGTASYLESSMLYFYTFEEEKNTTLYTSKVERSMRTTNQRINVGRWSDQGALNVAKTRDAYYYNGISPLNWKKIA